MKNKIIEAILKLNPTAEVSVSGEDINTIVWHNCSPIPKEQIEALFPIVEFEMALDELRAKRNKLLADTDYIVTMNLEAGNTIPAEWVTYRQSLRDLTNGLTTIEQVNAVVYPTKPE